MQPTNSTPNPAWYYIHRISPPNPASDTDKVAEKNREVRLGATKTLDLEGLGDCSGCSNFRGDLWRHLEDLLLFLVLGLSKFTVADSQQTSERSLAGM